MQPHFPVIVFLMGENHSDYLQAVFYCLGTTIFSHPSDSQLALRGKPKGCCWLWACTENVPSHLTWWLSGRQQAIFQNANWHLIIQNLLPWSLTSLARLILIYLNIFPFCWLLVFQSLLRIIKNEPETPDVQFCFLYLIQSSGDIVMCKMTFLPETYLNP